jgi:uridine kinase
LAELVVSRRAACPLRVAIDGPDAAGKTTLADEVAALLAASGRPVIRASIDGFHRPRAERYWRGRASPEGYHLDSFDHEALRNELLEPLGPDGDRWYRTAVFDVRSDSPRADQPLLAPSDAVLLFDGVFLLRPELNTFWDLRFFMHVELEEALRRGCQHDAYSAPRWRPAAGISGATCPARGSTSKRSSHGSSPTRSQTTPIPPFHGSARSARTPARLDAEATSG